MFVLENLQIEPRNKWTGSLTSQLSFPLRTCQMFQLDALWGKSEVGSMACVTLHGCACRDAIMS